MTSAGIAVFPRRGRSQRYSLVTKLQKQVYRSNPPRSLYGLTHRDFPMGTGIDYAIYQAFVYESVDIWQELRAFGLVCQQQWSCGDGILYTTHKRPKIRKNLSLSQSTDIAPR